MKNILILLLAGAFVVLTACQESSNEKTKKEVASEEELVEIKNGHYKEWYPGKKQVKFEGDLNQKGEREGKWNMYSEKGTLLSFTFYLAGKKHGHSVVKYPNGKIHYYGEYQNDQMVGEWVTYDAKGQKSVNTFDVKQ